MNETRDLLHWGRSEACATFDGQRSAVAAQVEGSVRLLATCLAGSERQNEPPAERIVTPADRVSRISRDLTRLPGEG